MKRVDRWSALLAALVGVLVVFALALPGTESGFTARVTNPGNSATTAATFNSGTLPYRSTFDGSDAGWTTYGTAGCWRTATAPQGFGTYTESCGDDSSNKAVTGSSTWTDYTAQADLQVLSGTQAGLLVRVTNPSAGAVGLSGYWASISTDGAVHFGRMDGTTYTPIGSPLSIQTGIVTGQWYHLVVQASGCTFTVTESTVGATDTYPSATFTDTTSGGCLTQGAIGLRDSGSTSAYRFVTASAGATTSTTVSPFNASFATGSASGFTPYNTAGPSDASNWVGSAYDETYANTSGGQGDKSVHSTTWGDATLTGDVRFTGPIPAYGSVNAGFDVRVSNPSAGVDALNGYYVGITRNALELGRQDSGTTAGSGTWTLHQDVPLGRTVAANEWWHLTVESVGCRITATAQPAAGGQVVTNDWTDTGCRYTTGAIAVRTFGVPAAWRDVAVTPR